MRINIYGRETQKSIEFIDGGYQFLKNDRICVCIPTISSYKKKRAGHIHLDVGTVTVSVDGTVIVVDPGTYTYTRDLELRKRYLGFHSHNMPVVNDKQVEGVKIPGYFNVEMENKFVITDRKEHELSYKHTYFGEEVTRTVKLDSNSIKFTDTGNNTILSTFHFHPKIFFIRRDSESSCRFQCESYQIVLSTNARIDTEEYQYSEEYGCTEKALKARIESNGKSKIDLSIK